MQKVFSLLIGVLFFTLSFAQKISCVITSPSNNSTQPAGVVIPVTVDVKNAKGEVQLTMAYYYNADDKTPAKNVVRSKSNKFPYTLSWDVTWWEEGSFLRVTATDSEGHIAISPPIKISIK